MPNPCPRCGQDITPEPGRGWVLGVQLCHTCIIDLLAGWVDTDETSDTEGPTQAGGLLDPTTQWVTNTTGTDEPIIQP